MDINDKFFAGPLAVPFDEPTTLKPVGFEVAFVPPGTGTGAVLGVIHDACFALERAPGWDANGSPVIDENPRMQVSGETDDSRK